MSTIAKPTPGNPVVTTSTPARELRTLNPVALHVCMPMMQTAPVNPDNAEALADIIQLSSGTMATITRSNDVNERGSRAYVHNLGLYDKHIENVDCMDAVRCWFYAWVHGQEQRLPSWDLAWVKYLNAVHAIRFESTYMGASTYVSRDIVDGYGSRQKWSVRHQTCDYGHMIANGDYWETGIFPAVGTIKPQSGNFHEFPPVDVWSLFPGYVPARWLIDDAGKWKLQTLFQRSTITYERRDYIDNSGNPGFTEKWFSFMSQPAFSIWN